MKKAEEKIKRIENSKDKNTVQDRLNKLKRLGVFVKTYNMGHLLATRYKVEEDFGVNKSIEKIDAIETNIKEKQSAIAKIEHDKEADKSKVEPLRKQMATLRDEYKANWREAKTNIGGELFNRFMKGFVRTKDNVEENERIAHSEFLFKKLKF